MKRRNQLLALFCLFAFAGFGVFYFRYWVVQKPFGIILFIGEGLTPGRIAVTRMFAAGAETRLAIDDLPHVALLSNYSRDFATPDQAAAASAIATGQRGNNRAISVSADGKALETLIERARKAGRSTGLVTDARLADPTSAAFYAHAVPPFNPAEVARVLLDDEQVDLALGGGGADFLPQDKNGRRRDQRDLQLEARRKGFDVVRNRAELEAIPGWRKPRVLGVFADEELASGDSVHARGDQPSLRDMVRRAIELLQFNRNGYLLVVDAGLMRKAAQENNAERTLTETIELDRAVAVARRYAGQNAAIIVCGDVGMGGLHLNGAPFLRDSGVALLGMNATGNPWFTWATGPNGKKTTAVAAEGNLPAGEEPAAREESTTSQEPAALYAAPALPTAEDVVGFAVGPRTEALHGSMDLTAIHRLISDSF
ncbi:MAG: alkaline phosphatase [Chthoniobacterales bacterium]|nr:alkaline phosphatase [Chthoniobacterales bacterium]